MTKEVFCKKLKKQADAMLFPPLPGEKGKFIFENISQEAWTMWLNHQTILINEYRLNLMDFEARNYLEQEMTKFLFGENSELPNAYMPEK